MTNPKFTPEQMAALAPLERYFDQATRASFCSYPGQANIDMMLETWYTLTGHRYGYKPGCPNCLVNLVRDMGNLYFAQKEEMEKPDATNCTPEYGAKLSNLVPPVKAEKEAPADPKPAKNLKKRKKPTR